MTLSACPGRIHATISSDLSPRVIRSMSPLRTLSPSAVAGDRYAALSQVIFVMGSGISWSHALLAWRPSSIFAST
jgi:hypothetical protein